MEKILERPFANVEDACCSTCMGLQGEWAVLRRTYGLSSMCLRPTTSTSRNHDHFSCVHLSHLEREKQKAPFQGAVRLGSFRQYKKSICIYVKRMWTYSVMMVHQSTSEEQECGFSTWMSSAQWLRSSLTPVKKIIKKREKSYQFKVQ